MNKTKESITKSISNDFELSDLLSDLIRVNVQKVAEEVVANYPKDVQSIDSAKVGAYECWVQRLTGMLKESELHYLLNLLQIKLTSAKERD